MDPLTTAFRAHQPAIDPPWALLAELTHDCPLHCVYCSNPRQLVRRERELSTQAWIRVLREAAELGVVQVHLSGGEPLRRADLEEIAAAGSAAGLYLQLTTSGIGLDPARASRLAAAGIRVVQLSVQAADAASGDRIAGYRGHDAKRAAAVAIHEAGLPMTINVVLHRLNLAAVADLIDLAVAWGADRLELANAQYYNWALVNRDLLLPDADQVERAFRTVEARRASLGERLQIAWVDGDYVSGRVKPCMGGWGRRSMTISPDGRALPCPAADSIGPLRFDSVVDHAVGWLWRESAAFNAYRGTAWMPEPCRSCDRREVDFGGCRCQAFALTGNASATDPVCELTPDHDLVRAATARARERASAGDAIRFVHRPTVSASSGQRTAR